MFESAPWKYLGVNSSLTLIKTEETSRYENIPPGIGFVSSDMAQLDLVGGYIWK